MKVTVDAWKDLRDLSPEKYSTKPTVTYPMMPLCLNASFSAKSSGDRVAATCN